MDSLRGQFLVASPHLPDPHFSRSVVLMLQHNSSGAVGVVLNRPTDNTIGDLWQHVGDESCTVEGFVHAGGPVAGPLMALHTNRSLAETEILPGLFVATDRDALTQLVQGTPDRFRLFSQIAAFRHRGAQHFAGRKLRNAVMRHQALRLGALAGPGRPQQNEVHRLVPRNFDFLISPSY